MRAGGRLGVIGIATVAGLFGLPFVSGADFGALAGLSSGIVRQGHSVPDPGNYRLNRFEMRPFVVDLTAPEAVELLVGVEGEGAQFVSIDTKQIDGFTPQILFLEDDGIPPDDIDGDGIFTGTLEPIDGEALPRGTPYVGHEVRVVELIVHGDGAVDETLVEDVAYSYGMIDGRLSDPISQVEVMGNGINRSDRVLNLVRHDLLVGDYPSIWVDERAVTRLVIEILGDRFDWIVFFGAYNFRDFPVSDHTLVRNHVRGIGQLVFDESDVYGSQGVLRSTLGLYRKRISELTHNMFHTWGVYGVERLGINSSVGGNGHWGALAAPGQGSVFGSPSVLEALERQEDGTYCGALSEGSMLDWERYLMGLIPASSVEDVLFLRNSSLSGFACEGYAFAGDRLDTLSMSRWIETFGPREPAYPDINRFKAAMVVVSDRALQDIEMEYLNRLAEDHENEFARVHEQMGILSYDLRTVPSQEIRGVFPTDLGIAIQVSGIPGALELETSSSLEIWNPLKVNAPTGEAVIRRANADPNEQWFIRWKQ